MCKIPLYTAEKRRLQLQAGLVIALSTPPSLPTLQTKLRVIVEDGSVMGGGACVWHLQQVGITGIGKGPEGRKLRLYLAGSLEQHSQEK